MKWSDVCEDPALRDLPFKVELNAQGQIIISPHKPVHSGFQGAIQRLLYELKPEGYILPEVAVDTAEGTKTVDVAWVSAETYEREIDKDAFEHAPEICIEVVSPANTMMEMERKKDLYIEKGASEVWICRENGQMVFLNSDGELERSQLCPAFPAEVSVRGRK